MVIGQEKICNSINSLTLDTFPRSLMLVGPRGGGKHLICDYIAEKFNLTQIDLTDTLDFDTIEELYNRVEPYLYLIRVNEISVKEENTILKFLEEPMKNSFIILVAETSNGLLQTIINRCQIWYLQNYKKEYLKTFLGDNSDFILSIAQTPGQVIEFAQYPLDGMIELADKILNKIETAGISNTLTLVSKIGFKNEKNTFDGKIFVDVLSSRIHDMCVVSTDPRYTQAYILTASFRTDLMVKNYDHRLLFEKYLIQLRDIMKGTYCDASRS